MSISGSTAQGNLIVGDWIGTDSNADNLGNVAGVAIDSAPGNVIGGTVASAANVIGFNTSAGVSITGLTATGNAIAGNFIGTDSSGTANLGNQTGVIIDTGTATTGNTIGGTVAGAGNTIADNALDAVDVNSGSGNAIRENLIYGNGGGIKLVGSANNHQAPPSQLAVASVPNLTTIDFTLTGSVGQSYTVDFFASNGSGGPAGQFLGTTTTAPLTSTTQGFTIAFSLAMPLTSPQAVTATVTGSDNSTSQFAVNAALPAAPFAVTNTTDGQPGSQVGSLRQAILDANSDPASAPNAITFSITTGTAPYLISVTSALPVITVPVTIEGPSPSVENGPPVIEISGGGQSFDGLVLEGPGSGGSTITGLSIVGFGNSTSGGSGFAGIHIFGSNGDVIESNEIGSSPDNSPAPGNGIGILVVGALNNTIGGTLSGTPNTIGSNIRSGVSVLSGNGNVISGNVYTGSNGSTVPVEAADIALAPNANDNQLPPVLRSASLLPVSLQVPPGNSPLLVLLVSGLPKNVASTIEFYQIVASPAERTFLGSDIITPTSSAPVSLSIPVSGLSVGDVIVATATVASSGTSAFSAEIQVASSFAVTNTNNSGIGSLEQAIGNVNADPNDSITSPDRIQFQIPASDPGYNFTTGVWTITLDSPLSSINKPLIIDATTQPGYYALASLDPNLPEAPLVQINGNGLVGDGLVLAPGSDGSSILGLSLFGFQSGTNIDGAGIDISSGDNTFAADWVGLGYNTQPGNAVGVVVDGSSGNTIGSGDLMVQPPPGSTLTPITVNAENVISGNQTEGILIESGAADNQIQNSFIGSDVSGQTSIANGVGIEILNSSDNIVGSTISPILSGKGLVATGLANVISGNKGDGVLISVSGSSSSSGNVVVNSMIGLDLSGSNSKFHLENGGDGVDIVGATGTQVGFGGTPQAPILGGNLISGNKDNGVAISGSASGTIVLDNWIGIGGSGGSTSTTLANGQFGVAIDTASTVGTTIGGALTGTLLGAGNVISGNAMGGISVAGDGANLITGNFIGTNIQGTGVLANGTVIGNPGPGILLSGSSDNTIGGTMVGAGNVISGNAGDGIQIESETGDLVAGNTIGTDVARSLALSNSIGVVIDGGASSNTIGATVVVGGNLIAGNQQDGLDILGGSTDNVVVANTIGATAGGGLGNAGNGIAINASANNTIGGAPVVDSNGLILSLGLDHNVISGNGSDGVSIQGTTIGAVTVEGNLVSGNTQNGIYLVGNLTDGILQVQILDNFVGTTLDGSSTYDKISGAPQGNGLDGIRLEQKSPATLSGTVSGISAAISGNVSSDNGLSGITVQTTGTGISYADISITDNMLGTDRSGTNTSTFFNKLGLPFGNALDGILINEVLGVTVGGTLAGLANVISGNLGQGIAIRGDHLLNPVVGSENLIQYNLIGTDISGTQGVDTNTQVSLGNLSDGIFLLDPATCVIQDNTISNNRAVGIHAQGTDGPSTNLTIIGNWIGTNSTGTPNVVGPSSLGNGSDGIFLSSVTVGGTVGGTVVATGNVISDNHANGIDLLESSGVSIQGNQIGTDATGDNDPNQSNQDFGNASNGIFINQSNDITIGGSVTGSGNLISGNHASGVFISGTSTNTAYGNLVQGNLIGVDVHASRQIANAVAGIVLSNAGSTVTGAGNVVSGNVVSGNLLNGILLVNNVQNNLITDNQIGTNSAGTAPVANSADGVLLLGVTVNSETGATITGTITGNTISHNTISGNNEDGIQIFGSGAYENRVSSNLIGLGSDHQEIANLANGVYLNNAGSGNLIGGITAIPGTGLGNVIAGNSQAGISIASTINRATQAIVEGNLIGIDSAETLGIGNRSYGVLIYGSSSNIIGGATTQPGTGAGNVISGNHQAGIQIYSPSSSVPATSNLVAGNLIGTGIQGESLPGSGGEGNGSDGVQIIDGQYNMIGGTTSIVDGVTYTDRNVISGNANNGVFIDQLPGSSVPSLSNQVIGNEIGTDISGGSAVANLGSGVQINDGAGNIVGGISGGMTLNGTKVPMAIVGSVGSLGNVISGNIQWGVSIVLSGASAGKLQTAIEGNDIGLDVSGTIAIGNGLGGIVVNNLSNTLIGQTIGGTSPGAGNVISGNSSVGVELIGPQFGVSGTNNVIEGNLIGLNTSEAVVNLSDGGSGNETGILVENSPNNVIGGTTESARNIISGNSQSGVQISQLDSTGNQVEGNFVGTNFAGTEFPGDSSELKPAQSVGVLINGASSNTVGGITAGSLNLISGDDVGIEITGLKQSNGQFLGSGNLVAGNRIGTDVSGTQPVSNLDLGVYINNAQGNVIGPGNDIAANGVAGVEILAEGSTGNLIAGNTIGLAVNGGIFSNRASTMLRSHTPEAGIPVFSDAQLNGVVILGASGNTIGLNKKIHGSAPNVISGNVEVGVYITSRDYNGVGYQVPTGNAVSGNILKFNEIYGVLLYNAPSNQVPPFNSRNRALVKNRYFKNKISFRNYQGSFDGSTTLSTRSSRPKHKVRATAIESPHHRVVKATVAVRPRVPSLFEARTAHVLVTAHRRHHP